MERIQMKQLSSNIYLGVTIILLIVGVVMIIIAISGQPVITDTDCYDRFGNQIIELTCESTSHPGEGEGIILLISGVVMIILYPFFRVGLWRKEQ